jgi:hypothetical protein
MNNEGKMARGWRLTKASWAVIRQDPTMISIALIGAGFALAGAAAIGYFGGSFDSGPHSRGQLALVAAIAVYPLTFISVFFNVALAGAAAAHFDGHPIDVREALAISWKRVGRIAQWALLAAGVGLVLDLLVSRIPFAGRFAAWLLDAAWSVATIFAVPLLAFDGRGPIDTAKDSIHLVKGKWGEGITGLVSIGAWTFIAMIPIAILIAVGVATDRNDPNLGAALIAIAVGGLLLVSALSLATREVFSVALYRYANGSTDTGAFAAADLEDPFSRRGRDD